ncbi:hypothetical protein FSO04_12055 [Paraburkholderia madseniana]|uniref:DUF4365 domain-containing protein n=1 Tax=Paraburkholderia madseniana TaxID=2599607 RepID=A0A6N6WGH2_9BURK|nr:hypothetical protein [Paraburkholderia madseniana]KAE8759633.1 hypothetical protein FSO04_12055 [Paraburkholderia madseniana]
MIDQQALGNKGEQRFGELCADTGLTFNKATLDLAGWDFIVNSDVDDTQAVSLDRRRTPFSCYVQVKTIWDTSRSVKLKLNMAERLGIEAIPSFICVFRVNRDRQFTDAFVIHVADDRLAAILKKLREAQADMDGVPLNKKFISFTPRGTERIDLTGIALREAFIHHIGPDFHSYIDKKREQRETLGFEGKPFQMSVVFENLSASELLDAFLGLTREVPVSSLEVVETRFEIPLPEGEPTTAKITIKPQPFDTCSITIRHGKRGWPAVFAGEIFNTPKVGSRQRSLIRSELFMIVVDRSTESGGKLRFEFSIEGKNCTASKWADYWRMLSAFRSGEGVVEIKPESMPVPLEFDITIDEKSEMEGQIEPDQCVRVLECLSNIIRHAGARPEPTFEYPEIFEQADRILALSAMMDAQTPIVTVHDPSADALDGIPIGPCILATTFPVGSTVFVFYATAFVETDAGDGGRPTVLFRDFQPKRLRIIEAGEKSRELFVENAQRLEGVTQVLWL